MTPTQELIMEVLTARYRLGERLWTFDSVHQKRMDMLEAEGLVVGMHGIVEGTIRASMTQKAIDHYVTSTYVVPRCLERDDTFHCDRTPHTDDEHIYLTVNGSKITWRNV